MKQKLFNIVAKNSGYQMVAHVVSLALGLLMTVALSRYLSVDGFGQYSYVFSFYFFFLALNNFGVNTVVIREISKDKSKAEDILSTILTFKLAISVLSIAIALTLIECIHFDPELKVILRLYAIVLPVTALQLPIVLFQVYLKMEVPSLIGIVKSAVSLIFVLAAAVLGFGLVFIIVSLLAAEVLTLCLILHWAKKYSSFKLKWNFEVVKHILKSSIPLGIGGLFVAVIQRIDFIMLERMTDLEQLGYYSAAYRIKSLAELVPIIVMASVFPLMSQLIHKDMKRLRNLYLKSQLYLAGLALAGAFFTLLFGAQVIRLVFGLKFVAASPGLVALTGSIIALYVAMSAGHLLISAGKEKLNAVLLAVAAVLNVLLNALWIPRYGFVGAAWATTAASVISATLVLISVEHFFSKVHQPIPESSDES